MSFFASILNFLRTGITRKQRDEEWASRFTNPPAGSNKPLPLDPGKSDFS